MWKLAIIIFAGVLSGCAPRVDTVFLKDGADGIRIFRKSDPPAQCKEIKPITASTGSGCGALGSLGSFESSYNLLRNMIFDMGGNAGLIQSEIPQHNKPYGNPVGGPCYVNAYVINGVAFKCPDSVLQ